MLFRSKKLLSFPGESVRDFQVGHQETGDFVALAYRDGEDGPDHLVGIDLKDGSTRPLLEGNYIQELAVSPRGDAIAYVDDEDGEVYYKELNSTSPLRLSGGIPEGEADDDVWLDRGTPRFSPDGSRVLYSRLAMSMDPFQDDKQELYVASVAGGGVKMLFEESSDDDLFAMPAGPGLSSR